MLDVFSEIIFLEQIPFEIYLFIITNICAYYLLSVFEVIIPFFDTFIEYHCFKINVSVLGFAFI